MFNFFSDNHNFPTKLFVTTSLLSLLLLGGIVAVLSSSVSSKSDLTQRKTENKTSFNDNKKTSPQGNPLITKVPKLKNMLKGPITDNGDPFLGSGENPVTIVEFADYKCEVCQKQQRILKNIRSAYKDKVRIIWKDYPVAEKDFLSFKAARAARCAHQQNSFWEYNKQLYKKDLEKEREFFVKIAEDLGLDSSSFSECFQKKKVDSAIMDNIKEANALGISGIPFIYVNDQEILGETSYEELKRLIELELND